MEDPGLRAHSRLQYSQEPRITGPELISPAHPAQNVSTRAIVELLDSDCIGCIGPLAPRLIVMSTPMLDLGPVESVGPPAALAVLLAMEAGLPVPVPTDLVLLFIGERAAAGAWPLWAAGLGLELVALAGTSLLFFAARGPAGVLLDRLGPQVGLTPARIEATAGLLHRRGRGSLALGRTTPGLRTVTVLAASAGRLRPAFALPPLYLGSSVFLQGHLLLGFWLGPRALALLSSARLPVLVALIGLMAVGVAVWLLRRGRRTGAQAWTEASCPACLALSLMTRSDAIR